MFVCKSFPFLSCLCSSTNSWDSFIVYWVMSHCHLFVLMLRVSQICLARAIQASLSFWLHILMIPWALPYFMAQDIPDPSWLSLPVGLGLVDSEAFARIALGLWLPGFILVMRSPSQKFSFPVSVLAGPASVFFRDWRHALHKPHQGAGMLRYHQYPGGHMHPPG